MEQESLSPFAGNKGLILAVIVGLIIGAIGLSAIWGSGSTSQYQGYIKKVESQTSNMTP